MSGDSLQARLQHVQGIAYGFIEAGWRRRQLAGQETSDLRDLAVEDGILSRFRHARASVWAFHTSFVDVWCSWRSIRSLHMFSLKAIFLCQLCACFLDGGKIVDSNKQGSSIVNRLLEAANGFLIVHRLLEGDDLGWRWRYEAFACSCSSVWGLGVQTSRGLPLRSSQTAVRSGA